MIFDNVPLENKLYIKVPYINGASNFKFTDLLCYLFALGYEYNGIKDDIMDTQSKVLHVKGFNFKANMQDLANYVASKGFTLEELGVSDFQVPTTSVLTYNQLMTIFTKNKNVYDHVVNQMLNADNKQMYTIYKKIYDSLMITELTTEFFKMNDGSIAKTYTDFLSERDSILYFSIMDIKSIANTDIKRQKISDIISDVVYNIEEYINTDEYKFLFSMLPTISAESVKHYIYKVINFFKSYKVDIMNINIIYQFDKFGNKITMIDEAIITLLLPLNILSWVSKSNI
jgi:hypothetical protein